MEVHFIDVGQADCVLILSAGHAMLVDAGNNADAKTITSYLNEQGVTRLDYVIGTHPHEDHIGSLDTVIKTCEIGEVILPDKIHTSKTFEDVLDAIETKGLAITLAEPGDTYPIGDASFTVLSPNADYGDNLNNWSVGIRLTNGTTSFLMSGDAEKAAEQDILDNGLDLSADVFKVSHHGSETSNSAAYLKAINPSSAVISCGENNQYGHPDSSVLEEFKKLGIDVYRTDEQGTIIAVSDGKTVTFSTKPSATMKSGTRADGAKSSSDNEPLNTRQSENGTTGSSDSGSKNTSKETASKPSPTPKPELKTETKSVTVHMTKTGSKYHSAGCQYLKKSDIEISLDDAKALGLTPCSKCHPPK